MVAIPREALKELPPETLAEMGIDLDLNPTPDGKVQVSREVYEWLKQNAPGLDKALQNPSNANYSVPQRGDDGRGRVERDIATTDENGLGVDLGEIFKMLPERQRNELTEAFHTLPKDLQHVVNDYGKIVKYDIPVNNDISQYNPNRKCIEIGDNAYTDDKLTRILTLRHEFGHFLDHMLGFTKFASSEGAFGKAFNEVRQAMQSVLKEDMLLKEKMRQAIEDSKWYNHPNVSDIFSSISHNKFCGAYGHESDYYTKYAKFDVDRREVFANLFAMKAGNDNEAIEFLRQLFPQIVQVFEKLLKSRRKH